MTILPDCLACRVVVIGRRATGVVVRHGGATRLLSGADLAFGDLLGERLAPSAADLASTTALDAWMRRPVTTTMMGERLADLILESLARP